MFVPHKLFLFWTTFTKTYIFLQSLKNIVIIKTYIFLQSLKNIVIIKTYICLQSLKNIVIIKTRINHLRRESGYSTACFSFTGRSEAKFHK